jgi:DNA-damage-inducible protein J
VRKAAIIRVRVEQSLKVEAEAVLAQLGLSPTEAIRLFYLQVSLQGGLPFEVRIPSAETRTAITDARSGKRSGSGNLHTWDKWIFCLRAA